MIPSGKSTDKIIFGFIYCLLIVLTAWGGTRLINYSLDSKFNRDYLQQWMAAIRTYETGGRKWPEFSGGNHSDYMQALIQSMQRAAVKAPASNMQRPYLYRLKKIGLKSQTIFLLCFFDKIILYGLPVKTFERLDKMLDGLPGKETGRFTGYRAKDNRTYIGLLKL
jgi:hypothetical protein